MYSLFKTARTDGLSSFQGSLKPLLGISKFLAVQCFIIITDGFLNLSLIQGQAVAQFFSSEI